MGVAAYNILITNKKLAVNHGRFIQVGVGRGPGFGLWWVITYKRREELEADCFWHLTGSYSVLL